MKKAHLPLFPSLSRSDDGLSLSVDVQKCFLFDSSPLRSFLLNITDNIARNANRGSKKNQKL
jgi:hypothetical protein